MHNVINNRYKYYSNPFTLGKLSISNDNHNIMNIIGKAQIRLTCLFVERGEKKSGLDLGGGYTGNRYSLYVSLSGQLKKRILILES